MPAPASPSQPDPKPSPAPPSTPWFAGAAGRAVLESENEIVLQAGAERPGQPWLWLVASPALAKAGAHGLALHLDGVRFDGSVRCGLPLPIASEAVGTVVLQHVGDAYADPATLLAECTRILLPGGRLWLLALN